MAAVTNINDVLDGHVGLDLDCVDRVYLNAYVPTLQVGGQVNRFLHDHLGQPVASPAVIERIGNRFRREVKAFADDNGIPVLRLAKPDRSRWDDRKLDHVRPHLDRAGRLSQFGVVAIVAGQEFQWVYTATKKTAGAKGVWFDWKKTERRVGVYYFYVLDPQFGPGFIKICTYFPYPAKVWVNGHEWAKRQADHEHLDYTALANGFASCADPSRLQAICDRFGPADLQGFFDRWTAVIPTPFTSADRAAGYWWELSMRQVEMSRTLVFDDPRRARGFFEALVTDNIGIGRPHEVHAVFGRSPRGRTTPQPFTTRLFTPGTDVKIDFRYKHSRVKQYLKEGRALRIETRSRPTSVTGRRPTGWPPTSPALPTPSAPSHPRQGHHRRPHAQEAPDDRTRSTDQLRLEPPVAGHSDPRHCCGRGRVPIGRSHRPACGGAECGQLRPGRRPNRKVPARPVRCRQDQAGRLRPSRPGVLLPGPDRSPAARSGARPDGHRRLRSDPRPASRPGHSRAASGRTVRRHRRLPGHRRHLRPARHLAGHHHRRPQGRAHHQGDLAVRGPGLLQDPQRRRPAQTTDNPLPGGSTPDKAIDSRAGDTTPIPDPELHRTTVAAALAAHQPTVVVVSTPTYCISRFCGPITDSVAALARTLSDKAAFVHLEVWQDFDKHQVNPAAAQWIDPTGAEDATEPWTFVIDRTGRITHRFDNVGGEDELRTAVEQVTR